MPKRARNCRLKPFEKRRLMDALNKTSETHTATIFNYETCSSVMLDRRENAGLVKVEMTCYLDEPDCLSDGWYLVKLLEKPKKK